MASSQPRGGQRVYHQDYIARIRYSNTLPPPPFPPKLLNIPDTGLSSGQYTSAAYSSRLAREQALNIEADAELGMPLDLVGMPGIFDGDESAIQPEIHAVDPHPDDVALLRPLATLGKPTGLNSGVSFLRRTEYISSEQRRTGFESSTSKSLIKSTISRRPVRKPNPNLDDPINILRSIAKGFDIAYPKSAWTGADGSEGLRGATATKQERDAWENPRHPTDRKLTVLDKYPLLPDLESIPDSGGYMIMKFLTNPVTESDKYDSRLDVAILRPIEMRPELEAQMRAVAEAHEADPSKPPPGPPPFDYEYYLPAYPAQVTNIKRKMNPLDAEVESASLYSVPDSNAKPVEYFRYERERVYETIKTDGGADRQYDEVAITLNDGETVRTVDADGRPFKRRKAAYYYPILQRSQIRPRRDANIGELRPRRRHQRQEEDEDTEKVMESQVDIVQLHGVAPDETEAERRRELRERVDIDILEEYRGGDGNDGTESEDIKPSIETISA